MKAGTTDSIYHYFLAGEGEMATLTRNRDWSKTALGAPETWPQSLKTTLSIVLNSRFPMLLFWGNELICFYNDAYRPSLGNEGKHPLVLGLGAKEAWPEIWEVIKPMIDQVIQGKGAVWHEDRLIPIYRNGHIEDVYWTFSYSPVISEDEKIEGVLVTCTETTAKVKTLEHLAHNEEKLNIIIEASDLGTWELNLETQEVSCSPRYLEILGYKGHEQLSHKELKDHIYPEDRLAREKAYKDSFITGVLDFETRIVWKDKSVHWIHCKGKVLYDERNLPLKLVGTVRDISREKSYPSELESKINQRTSELQKLNTELEKSEARYHMMVDEVQEYAILYLNSEGVVEHWNKGAEKIKGYTAQEIIGKNFSIFYTAEDRASNLPQTLLNRARTTDKAVQQGWRVRKDGSLFWASVVITAIHDEERNVIGFSKVTHDLTEKKQAEDQLKQYAAQLEKKNRDLEKINSELQSFAYVSSHDLQEPLRKIQTFANRIQEKEAEVLSESGKDYFRRMQNAARRMQTLIQDLLSYSRTSTGERKFVTIDLEELIEEIRSDLKETLHEKNAVLETKVQGKLDVIPFQFRQLLDNLISNALKFVADDVQPVITLESRIVHENLDILSSLNTSAVCHIRISDNGIGFDPQYKERIFEIFQRLHGRSEYSGTGIGLAIVKKIVENHDGMIEADAELGKGARFDVYIPVSRKKYDQKL